MKHNLKVFVFILCIALCALVLCSCNFPIAGGNKAPEAAPASGGEKSEESEDMMIRNNSGGSEEGKGSESETPKDEEEPPMISNPGHSSAAYPKTASLSFRSASSAAGVNAQIQRPDEKTDKSDDDVVIVNDHKIAYPETPSIIQKSVDSGKLAPLSSIPPQALANGQSIVFAPGATSAIVSGYVPAGGYLSYNFYAFANQNFLVLLTSDSGTSVLSISDVYGNVFLDAGQRQTSYNMYLPRTATYYVNIHSQGYAENVTLQVFIPARVTIPMGKTSTVMSGSLTPYSVVSYTAYMYAGQTARIDDYSGAQPTSYLRVSGLQTGLVYMDYTAYSPSWYSVVPATQDYLIEVITMDLPSNYRLTVDVR